MKEMFQRIKADMILSAVLCTILGIVIFLWPEETIDIVCKALAVGLIIMGAVNLFSYFTDKLMHPFSGIIGLILVLVGIWIFTKPGSILSLVPIVVGVVLAIHGIQDLKLAFETKGNGYEKWWIMLIIALVSLIFGVVCIINAFGMVKLALKIAGIMLVYDGISDLWIVTKAVRTAKAMEEEAAALDVEYKEMDDEK